MAARKTHTVEQRLAHMLIVQQLMRNGKGTCAIARATNRSPAAITRDKKRVIADWKRELVEHYDDARAVLMHQTDAVLDAAWTSFAESRSKRIVTTKRVKSSTRGGQPSNEAVVVEEQQYGDPRFLNICMDAIRKKADILGIDAPKQVKADVTSKTLTVHADIGLQETMELLESIVGQRTDQAALPEYVQAGPVLPPPLRTQEGGCGTPVDTGQVQGGAEQPQRTP